VEVKVDRSQFSSHMDSIWFSHGKVYTWLKLPSFFLFFYLVNEIIFSRIRESKDLSEL